MFPNQRVVTPASGEHVANLSIVEAGEYYTSFAEFLLETPKRIDVDFVAHIKAFCVINHVS
jgi:hypothetical protein